MTRTTCSLIILLGLASPSMAATQWVQIKPGYSFEYARAVARQFDEASSPNPK